MIYRFSPVLENGEVDYDVIEDFSMPMSEACDEIERDGKTWRRNYGAENKGLRNTAWSTPLKSDSAGVGLSQIAEAEKRNAKDGNNVTYDRTTGQAIFRSRSQRAAFLRDRGLRDNDGGYKD